jgi:hypothetical protein
LCFESAKLCDIKINATVFAVMLIHVELLSSYTSETQYSGVTAPFYNIFVLIYLGSSLSPKPDGHVLLQYIGGVLGDTDIKKRCAPFCASIGLKCSP